MPDPGLPVPAPLLKPEDAALILSISTRTLKRMIKRGDIAFVRVGGSLRFKPDDLVTFIRTNRTSGDE